MTLESDIADVYELILKKQASETTAYAAAMALGRERMPNASDRAVRETVARAIATVRIRALHPKPDGLHTQQAEKRGDGSDR